jgi:4-amino-4-deoxy-L-arabinose transferase-like glycosyltransferase
VVSEAANGEMTSQACDSPGTKRFTPSTLLLFLWLCFVARGCFYSALLPPWEGYDEPFHFAFIQYMAAHRDLPRVTTPVSREVQASLHLLPLSWEQRLHVMAPPFYTEDSYWQLPEHSRQELQEEVRSIPLEWQSQTGTAPAMYEAQQAPLYYWMMAVPLSLVSGWSLPARVMLVRILSVLLASVFVPIAYAAAKRFFADDAQALGIVTVIACMPELMIDISRVGNESLAIVVYSLLTLLLLLAVQRGRSQWFVAAGVVLGLGLLTKAYFVFAIPAFLLVAVYSIWRCGGERKQIVFNTAAGTGLAALISFGWYWRNHVIMGAWSGEQDAAVAAHATLPHLIIAVRHVNWIGGVASVLISHTWFGGWSFLKLPKLVYAVFAFGMAAALFGLLKTTLRYGLRSGHLVVLLALYGWFWVGLLCDVLVLYIARGVSASCGWYLYAVVLPEVLLVAWGFYSLVPERLRWAVLPAIAAIFAVIDLYGTHFLLVPYYTGLIAHVPNSDVVHPATLLQLVSAGPSLVLDRLRANRPVLFGRGFLATLVLLYYAATVLAVAIAYKAMRRTFSESLPAELSRPGTHAADCSR